MHQDGRTRLTTEKNELVPFLKWAGGKRWFIDRHRDLFPPIFNTYHEPFLGSGAIFFALNPTKGMLSDLNPDLVNAYNVIKNDWKGLLENLKKHQENHCLDYYYKIREQILRNPINRAAQFIYLNRTCWNGLYRVNLKGKFNVPIGTKISVILDTDDLKRMSRILQNVPIESLDFETAIDKAREKDFIFIDPPYTVKHNFNGFIKYNERLFSWNDQVRLRDAVLRAVSRGVKVLITNADHPSIRDLYINFKSKKSVPRASVLAADSRHRSPISEFIVRSW